MSTEPDDAQIRDEYAQQQYLYAGLCREVVRQLDELIQRERIALAVPIESRVKTLESVLDKVARYPKRFLTLAEMRDVAGIRVVLLFRRDVDRVAALVREHFQVVFVEDTQDRLEADRFGYASLHFEVQPRNEWLSVPSWKPLAGLSAEIQVRTASQHIWAASSHVLQYKKEAHVPVPMRRAINRAAALLELVDLEWERVLAQREGYQAAVSSSTNVDSDELDVDVLRQLLSRLLPPENRADGDDEMLSVLLDELEDFKVTTPAAVERLLKGHKRAISRAEAAAVAGAREQREKGALSGTTPERVDRGVFFTHVGLARQGLREEFGIKYDQYLARKTAQKEPPAQRRPTSV